MTKTETREIVQGFNTGAVLERTEALAWYTRAEKALFGTLSQGQWDLLDSWSQENSTLEQLALSLSPEQEPIMLAWAARLLPMLEEVIRAKGRTARPRMSREGRRGAAGQLPAGTARKAGKPSRKKKPA